MDSCAVQVKMLKEARLLLETRAEETRAKEQTAVAAANILRADMGAAAVPPGQAAQADEKKVHCSHLHHLAAHC